MPPIGEALGDLTERITFWSDEPHPIAVVSLTASGTRAIGRTAAPHELATGDYVTVSGATPAAYNVSNVQIIVTTPDTFSYPLPAGLPTYRDRVLADHPSHYWRLGETSGAVAVDQIAGLNGTIAGGVTLGQPGAIDSPDTAAAFDGMSGQIVTPPGRFQSPLTLEFWFATVSNGEEHLFNTLNWPWGGGTNEDSISVRINAGRIQFYLIRADDSSGGSTETTRTLSDGAWHHVILILQTTGAAIYIDAIPGVLASDIPWPIGSTNNPFEFGYYSAGPAFGRVTLDEIAIYPAALTPAQIADHYAGRTLLPPATGAPAVLFLTDAQGGGSSEWRAIATAWAAMIPISAADLLHAEAIGSTLAYRAVTPYRPDLEADMRLEWRPYRAPEARRLEIHGVLPHPSHPRRLLVLECGEVVA